MQLPLLLYTQDPCTQYLSTWHFGIQSVVEVGVREAYDYWVLGPLSPVDTWAIAAVTLLVLLLRYAWQTPMPEPLLRKLSSKSQMLVWATA